MQRQQQHHKVVIRWSQRDEHVTLVVDGAAVAGVDGAELLLRDPAGDPVRVALHGPIEGEAEVAAAGVYHLRKAGGPQPWWPRLTADPVHPGAPFVVQTDWGRWKDEDEDRDEAEAKERERVRLDEERRQQMMSPIFGGGKGSPEMQRLAAKWKEMQEIKDRNGGEMPTFSP